MPYCQSLPNSPAFDVLIEVKVPKKTAIHDDPYDDDDPNERKSIFHDILLSSSNKDNILNK